MFNITHVLVSLCIWASRMKTIINCWVAGVCINSRSIEQPRVQNIECLGKCFHQILRVWALVNRMTMCQICSSWGTEECEKLGTEPQTPKHPQRTWVPISRVFKWQLGIQDLQSLLWPAVVIKVCVWVSNLLWEQSNWEVLRIEVFSYCLSAGSKQQDSKQGFTECVLGDVTLLLPVDMEKLGLFSWAEKMLLHYLFAIDVRYNSPYESCPHQSAQGHRYNAILMNLALCSSVMKIRL